MAWFDEEKRDLPWRRSSDPYRIWISEIMLQQTRVETVLPYYERFLRRFPDVSSLAASPLDDVLAAWSGLGYYRRARFLHRASRQIASEGGAMPTTIAGLRSLPGVGEYTAAAIGSIAYGIAEPVLDGNVERVLARLVGESDDVKRAPARRRLRALAAELLVEARAGDSNQALMELGATICTPRAPLCTACPWRAGCVAFASGAPETIPTRRRRRRRERVDRTVLVVRDGKETLLFRRPEESELLAGTWELPWIEGHEALSPPSADRLSERYGGSWRIGARLGRVRHAVTYRDLHVDVWSAEVGSASLAERAIEAGWFPPDALEGIALSSLVRKALALG